MASFSERRGQIDPGVKYTNPNASQLIGQLGDFVDTRVKAQQASAKQASAVAGAIEQERANEARRKALATAKPEELVDLSKPWLVREEAATFMGSEYVDAYNNTARAVFHSQVQTELTEKLSDLKQKYKHDPSRKRSDFMNDANRIVQSTRTMLASSPETRDLAQAEFTQYAEKFAQDSYLDIVMEDHNIQTKQLILDYKNNLHARMRDDTDMIVDHARASSDPLKDFEEFALPMIRKTNEFINLGVKSQFTTGEEMLQTNDTYASDWVTRYRLMLWERDQANALTDKPTALEANFVHNVLNNGAFFDKNQFDAIQRANAKIDDAWGGQYAKWVNKWLDQAVPSKGGKFGSLSEVIDLDPMGNERVFGLKQLVPTLKNYAGRFGKGDPRYNTYMDKALALENTAPIFELLKDGQLDAAKAYVAKWFGAKSEGGDTSSLMPAGDADIYKRVYTMVNEYYDSTRKAVRSGNTAEVLSNVGSVNDYSARVVRSRVRDDYAKNPEKYKVFLDLNQGDEIKTIHMIERAEVGKMIRERAEKAGNLVAVQGLDPTANSYTLWSTDDAAEYAGDINRYMATGDYETAVRTLDDFVEISGQALRGSEAASLRQLDVDGKQGLGTIATTAWAVTGGDKTRFNDLFRAAAAGAQKSDAEVRKEDTIDEDTWKGMDQVARAIGTQPEAVRFMVAQAWKYYYTTQGKGADAAAFADEKVKAMVNFRQSNIQNLSNGSVVMMPDSAMKTDAPTRMNNILTNSFRNHFGNQISLPPGVDMQQLRWESRETVKGTQMVLVNNTAPAGSNNRTVKWHPNYNGSKTALHDWYKENASTGWFDGDPAGDFIFAEPGAPVGFYVNKR